MDAFQHHIEAAEWLREAGGTEEPVDPESNEVGSVTVTVGDVSATEPYDPILNEDYARAFVAACAARGARWARRRAQHTDCEWKQMAAGSRFRVSPARLSGPPDCGCPQSE